MKRIAPNVRIAALLLLTSALHAQFVDGTLTDSISRLPIPGVIVTLLGPVRYNNTTDEAGLFHIGPVQPGKYMLNIVKSGYVLPPSRQAPFQIDSDTRLPIEMDPLCLVEGRVGYPDGRPAPRASVWLIHPTGAPRNVTADIGGHFLFDDVNPGEYILQAAAANGDPRPEGEIWAPTYFPSTDDRAAAEPIRAVTGLVATHDIRLRSMPARRIHGIVRDEKGAPANRVTVTLISNATGGRPTTQTTADGAFDFLALNGQWRLSADSQGRRRRRQRKGFADATVAGHDIENVDIRRAPILRPRRHRPRPGAPRRPSRLPHHGVSFPRGCALADPPGRRRLPERVPRPLCHLRHDGRAGRLCRLDQIRRGERPRQGSRDLGCLPPDPHHVQARCEPSFAAR